MKLNLTVLAVSLAGLALPVTTPAASGTWTNRLGGTWSTAANWSNSIVADGADFTADFSALPAGIVSMTVTNDAAHSLAVLRFGAVTNTFLVGASTITLQTNSGIPNVNVVNNTARVGVPLASSQQVLMSGASLALTNDLNTLSGGVVIQCSQFGFTSQSAIGSGTIQLGNGPGGNVAGPGQTGFNAISAATAGTAPVILTNDFVVRTVRWIAGQSGVGLNAQPIIINGNVSLDMGTNGVRDFALQQPLTINGVLSSVPVPGGGYGITFGALAGGPLTLGNSGNTFVGNITFGNAQTLGINSDGALGYFLNRLVFNAAGTLRADAPLTISATRTPITMTATATFNCQTNDVQLDPQLVGAGGLTKNGTGRLTVTSSANTFTGNVTVNGGTLDLQGNLATAGTVTINNAGQTNGSTFLLGASSSAPAISVTVNNGGTFDATAQGGYTFVSGKTLSVPAGGFVKAAGGTITMNSGATFIAGSGTSNILAAVDGSVVADSDSVLIPGTQGTAGTISITNALTLNGQSIQFDLRNDLTEGSGTNDLILVGGALTLNGGEKIVLNYLDGALVAGTYTLMRCASQSGTFTLAAAYPNVALDQSSGTNVLLVVSGPAIANTLFWKGDGAGNVWDANTTANWVTNFASPALTYSDPSKVTFDNNGSNNVAVNLVSTVLPNTVTFSNTKPYTISGVGKISGPVAVTVASVATNTILTDNDYAGGTTFTAGGTIQIGNGGATGSVGSGAVALGATTGKVIVNRNNAVSLTVNASGASTVMQLGSGTTTLTGTADCTAVGIISNGVLQLAKTSSGAVHALGSAILNTGGTLQLGGSGGDQINNAGALTMAGGTFDANGLNESVTNFNGFGEINSSSGTLTGLGTTVVQGGTLTLQSGGLTFNQSSTANGVAAGGTLSVTGGTLTSGVLSVGTGGAGVAFANFSGGTYNGTGEFIGGHAAPAVTTVSGSALLNVNFYSYGGNAYTNYLNGGTIRAALINQRAGGAPLEMFFNGVTIEAKANQAAFFPKAGATPVASQRAYISTNGLIFNTAGFNIGMSQNLEHNPALGLALDGGLTKIGAGTLTLTGTNTFNGSITNNQGTLAFNNSGSYNNVVMGDNAINQINLAGAGTSLTNSTLTIGATGGGTQWLNFNLGTFGTPTVPLVTVNGVVTNSGQVVVTLIAPFLTPGTVPLIKYGSMDAANFAGTWSIAPFPYVDLTLTNDTVNKLISVVVVPGVTPTWKGNISSAWDTTTLNWTSNGSPALYVETAPPGQPVVFDQTASSFIVDISTATVNPAFISMSNTTAYTVTGTLGIGGTGALIKNGSGSLVLSNASAANTYSGITLFGGGSLVAAVPNVLSPNSTMTFNNSTLDVGANNQTVSSSTFNNASLLGTGTLTGSPATTLTFNNAANFTLGTPLAGTLGIVLTGAGEMTLPNANTFTRDATVASGTLRIQNGNALGAGGFIGGQITTVASGACIILDGSFTIPESVQLNGNGPDGSGALMVTNGVVTIAAGNNWAITTPATVNVANGAVLTNAGTFFAVGPLTKTGPGLLYCAGGVNLNSVILNQGTLIVAAAIGGAGGELVVNSSATFGGAATVAAPTTIQGGASLHPGNLAIGTLTINNHLTNAGAILLEVSKTGLTLASDQLVVNSNFVHTGSLTVTNVGPDALAAGDVFQLFATNYAAIGSAPISLPPLGAGLGWTNNLGVDGTIAVISVAVPSIPTTPTNLTFSVSGGNLTLSWPSNYVGWILQSQTNARSVGLTVASNAWFDVAGSAGLTSTNLPINPTDPTVFFRLRYP